LFYRLNVVPIILPPLRERADDLPLLLDHYLQLFAKENGVTAPRLSAGALAALQKYAWPGNVRELRNFCENAVVLKRGGEITEYDLDPKFLGGPAAGAGGAAREAGGALARQPFSKAENEKRLLRQALVEARGNRTKAAQLMGISRRTLHRKLVEWPELDVAG
jgi:DNA-binding NtrC family response regulator